VSNLTIGLLGALLATNQPQAVSNLIQQQTGLSVAVPGPGGPQQAALLRIMEDDDTALAEVDGWIQTNDVLAANGAGEPKEVMNQRIHARLDAVRMEYVNFLQLYPNDAKGHLAYGTFLNDIGEEAAAAPEFQSACNLDPKDPAAWNDLANYYGENGPVTNAFADYARAIALNPNEPVYYRNFATTVYLYRKDAREFYGISEQQVFDQALDLYRKAVQLDPENFSLATDYAESYYGIRPLRTNDALAAWTNALAVAHDETEREGVFIHLARVKLAAGRFAEAQAHLDAVTNSIYAALKQRLERNLAARENGATNLDPAVLAKHPALTAPHNPLPNAQPVAAATNTPPQLEPH